MGRDVDDVVRSRHDVDITVLVDHACVPGVHPPAIESLEVSLVEALFVVEERREGCGRQRHGHHDVPHGAGADWIALVVHDANVEARHRFPRRARFDR